jgi:hypothetical protein
MMTDVRHTPGPWIATPANSGEWNINSVDEDDGWCIATVMGGAGLEDPNGRSDENACLIAAAPDMLAALRATREWMTGMVKEGSEPLTIIDAALAKAVAPVAGLERVG